MAVKYISELEQKPFVLSNNFVVVADPAASPGNDALEAYKATIEALANTVFSLAHGILLQVRSISTFPSFDDGTASQGTIITTGQYATLSEIQDYEALKEGDIILVHGHEPLEVYKKIQDTPTIVILLAAFPLVGIDTPIEFKYRNPSYRSFDESGEVSVYDSVKSFRKVGGFVYADRVVTNSIKAPFDESNKVLDIEGGIIADGISVGWQSTVAGEVRAKRVKTDNIFFYDSARANKFVTDTNTAIDISNTGECSFPGSAMLIVKSKSEDITPAISYKMRWDFENPVLNNRIDIDGQIYYAVIQQPGLYYVTATLQFKPTVLGTLPNYSQLHSFFMIGSTAQYRAAFTYRYFKDLFGPGVIISVNMSQLLSIPSLPYKIGVGFVAYTNEWGYLANESVLAISQLNGSLT